MIPDSGSAGGGVEEKSQPSCAQADTPSAALVLIERGFSVCRPDPLTKKPTYKSWSSKSLKPDDFRPGDPLGILAGPLSNGKREGHAAVILDLDIEAAIRLADDHLPMTGMREGRASKPRSHRYFLVPLDSIPKWALSMAGQGAKAAKELCGHPGPFIKSFRHRGTDAEGIRFIGTGGQVVCPPSVHPSGEVRMWDGGPLRPPYPSDDVCGRTEMQDAAVAKGRRKWRRPGVTSRPSHRTQAPDTTMPRQPVRRKCGLEDVMSPDAADPGDLAGRIDRSYRRDLPAAHRALDGGPHLTPDELAQLEADIALREMREGSR
jgi:hypothetical protein